MNIKIRKMQTSAGGPIFTPEQMAAMERIVRLESSPSSLVKGINTNSNRTVGTTARKAGIEATRTRQRRKRVEDSKPIGEMHTPVPVATRQDPVTKEVVVTEWGDAGPNSSGAMSGRDPMLGTIFDWTVGARGIDALGKTALWNFAKYGPSNLFRGLARNYFINNAFKLELRKPILFGVLETLQPQVRTKVGDVEIDNPNLLYHLDRGDSAGAFSNQGAYVKDGRLLPGIVKEGEVPYSWWNLGRPYATSVNGQPMTRLMTATENTPGMLHVRSQNYPIGQWNGKRGLVTNAEYVNPEGVDVLGSTYTLDPGYGWRRVFAEEPSTSLKFFERKPAKSVTREYVQSPKNITSDVGDLIAEGSERSTYTSKSNPNIVYKIEDAPLDNIKNIKIRKEVTDDIIAPEITVGYYNRNGKYYRVTLLDKYKSWNPDDFDINYSPELDLEIIDALQKAKWDVELGTYNGAPYARTASKNGIKIGNLEYFNWGRDSHGNLKLIDLYVYSLKQGGKMNILEFLKNGSGIHIKKKNRGSFTRWCGGNVTEECIRRGKASSNPKIRKKATFADNARHFKHKSGGKAFVEGVNVLDSNPNMYRKKKIRKGEEGTKLQLIGQWISNNKDSISGIISGVSSLVGSGNTYNKKKDALDALRKAFENSYADLMLDNIDLGLYAAQLKQMNPDSNYSSIDMGYWKNLLRQLAANKAKAYSNLWYLTQLNLLGNEQQLNLYVAAKAISDGVVSMMSNKNKV